jgi:hypothetical protein
MASSIHIARIAVTLKLKLPAPALQQYLPVPLETLGGKIARQVDAFVKQRDLGYYPALDFFQLQGGVDEYLLSAVQEVANLAQGFAATEIESSLQPIFSSVSIGTAHCLAYAMPTVRPGQTGAVEELARHYTPVLLKFEIMVTLIQRHEPPEGIEKSAKHMVYRWLSEVFEEVEITSARLIPK